MIDLKTKKILITGANGFVGKHLVQNLLELKNVSLNNLYTPDFKELDLRKWEDCQKAVQGKDVVIHLAAKVGGIGLNREIPGEMFYDNIIMGTQLMEAARQAKVEKFVALGTICAYPKFTLVPFKEENLWNGYPEETNASYGMAKKMLLVQSQAYRQQYGFNSIYLLPINLYGPGDNFSPQSSHVIPALIKKCFDAKRNGSDHIVAWGTGRATREFLYVDDLAEACVFLMDQYNSSDVINVGAGKETSIQQLAAALKQITGFHGKIIFDTKKPDGNMRRFLDSGSIFRSFGR